MDIVTPTFAWSGKESSVISDALCLFLQQLIFSTEAFNLNFDDLFMVQKFILLWYSRSFTHVSNIMIHVLNIFLKILEVSVT